MGKFIYILTYHFDFSGITITMLIAPFMVDGFVKHNTPEEWRWVFLTTAAILVIANILFLIMASADPAPWTGNDFSREPSRHKTNSIQPMNAAALQPKFSLG